MGDVVAIELSIQGTFRGPMETPAGVIQPTGAKVNILGVPPDFASAVKRSTQR
jgi:hypothetical protein